MKLNNHSYPIISNLYDSNNERTLISRKFKMYMKPRWLYDNHHKNSYQLNHLSFALVKHQFPVPHQLYRVTRHLTFAKLTLFTIRYSQCRQSFHTKTSLNYLWICWCINNTYFERSFSYDAFKCQFRRCFEANNNRNWNKCETKNPLAANKSVLLLNISRMGTTQ